MWSGGGGDTSLSWNGTTPITTKSIRLREEGSRLIIIIVEPRVRAECVIYREDARAHACKVVINIEQLTISTHLHTHTHTATRDPALMQLTMGRNRWGISEERIEEREETKFPLYRIGTDYMGVPIIGRWVLNKYHEDFVPRQDEKLIDIAQDVENFLRQ